MRTIEKTIYNFNELNKEIQEKLIENEKETDRDFYISYYLHDDMGSKASDLINDYFGVESDYLYTYYDLDYSQGSGAMIEFNISMLDINKALKGGLTKDEIKLLTDYNTMVEIRHNNSHYYHEYTFNFDYSIEYEYDDNYIIGLSEKLDVLMDKFKEYVIKMNKELTRYGYDVIENYCTDVDCIVERLNENEYYENGEVYHG